MANISTQVGGLYAPGDHRRDRAYRLFNLLRRHQCRRVPRAARLRHTRRGAGLALWVRRRRRRPDDRARRLLYAVPMLPPDEMHKAKAAGLDTKPLDRNEWRAVLALITLFLPTTMFWATYEQQGNTIARWADEHTDRTIDLIVWHGEIPVTWFIGFWAWQEKRGMEPS